MLAGRLAKGSKRRTLGLDDRTTDGLAWYLYPRDRECACHACSAVLPSSRKIRIDVSPYDVTSRYDGNAGSITSPFPNHFRLGCASADWISHPLCSAEGEGEREIVTAEVVSDRRPDKVSRPIFYFLVGGGVFGIAKRLVRLGPIRYHLSPSRPCRRAPSTVPSPGP